jgi:chromatin remodeling complex protein RSC6
MADFSLKLQQVISLLSATKVSFKALEKIVVREFKVSQKASSKKSKRSGNRQPSGFVRPTLISEELALFLGKEVGTEMARTSVSKEINQYIRTNQLQDKSNGRQINADANLITLLKLEAGDVLTYFNLQRYMKHHFVKVTPPEVVAPVVV